MPLTPSEIEAERERFEAWYVTHWNLAKAPEREGKGYLSGVAYHTWEGWLAAIESERERVWKERSLFQGEGK